MTLLTVACLQMRTGTDPETNLPVTLAAIAEAADQGAHLVATPEMTNLVDIRPGHSDEKITTEAKDTTLKALRMQAAELGLWLLIGSLAVTLEEDTRKANRSYLISPNGDIVARYDKIHMFDVEVGDGQSYRESKAYRPGEKLVLASTPFAKIGMSICYDLRFPGLYRTLAQAGADLLTIPAAFTRVTGEAHWHALIRARAIETGCFVLAPAQGGLHEDGRETFGHSLIVSPWGEIIAEAAHDEPAILLTRLDLTEVTRARQRIPSLSNERHLRFEDER
ncbi:MAG: carbon-nitrogen hydrolase family protein [Pseudomonadota bacterium]